MEDLIYIIEASILALIVAYMVWQYSDKHVPLYVKVLTFWAWLFTFSAFIILPIDIANGYRQENIHRLDLTDRFLNVLWRVLYWSNFLLSFFVLPLCQDYEDSGEFTFKTKFKASIKKNLIIYGAGLVAGLILIVYLLFSRKLSFAGIVGILAGLGNLIGIMMIILLLGYGFVAIPKKYIQESNQENELQHCYSEAVQVAEYRQEKMYDLEEKCRILYLLNRDFSGTAFESYIKLILNEIPDSFQDTIKRQLPASEQSKLLDNIKPLTMAKIADLNREVKRLLFDLRRVDTRFQILCDRSWRLEQQAAGGDTSFSSQGSGSIIKESYFKCVNVWTMKMHKLIMRYTGYIFALMSAILLVAELSIFTKAPINLIKIFLKQDTGYYPTQITLFPFLVYIACCTYYGLFHLKIAGLFSFNSHHQTDAPSLMFGSINFGRVSFPLCYNFLQLCQPNIKTAFSDVIGDMNVVPIFGSTFSVFLPLLLILMCMFNIFNVGGKLMSAIGLSGYATQEDHEGQQEEGKKILKRERELMIKMKDVKSGAVQELAWTKDSVTDRRDSTKNQYVKNFNDILNI